MQSIWRVIVEAVSSLMTFLKLKQEQKSKEFEIINSQENHEREEKVRESHSRDSAEEIISKIKKAETDEEKKKYLDELRRRVSR